MPISNLIVKSNELTTIQHHNTFVLEYIRASLEEGTPVVVVTAVAEYLLQHPGRAWWGCSVEDGVVTIAIPDSDDDLNAEWINVIVINHCADSITVNDVIADANVSAILDAMNNVMYDVVVPDMEFTTAAAKQTIAESRSEILAAIVAETVTTLPTKTTSAAVDNTTLSELLLSPDVKDTTQLPVEDDASKYRLTEVSINAKSLVDKLGERLIGVEVTTQAMGEWPGGVARVITIYPDSACPEIVFEVGNTHGCIGVFAEESVIVPVSLLTDK